MRSDSSLSMFDMVSPGLLAACVSCLYHMCVHMTDPDAGFTPSIRAALKQVSQMLGICFLMKRNNDSWLKEGGRKLRGCSVYCKMCEASTCRDLVKLAATFQW